jgi:hypothetical protein
MSIYSENVVNPPPKCAAQVNTTRLPRLRLARSEKSAPAAIRNSRSTPAYVWRAGVSRTLSVISYQDLHEPSNHHIDSLDQRFLDLLDIALPPPPFPTCSASTPAPPAISSKCQDAKTETYEPVRRISAMAGALPPPRCFPGIRWGKLARVLYRQERAASLALARYGILFPCEKDAPSE